MKRAVGLLAWLLVTATALALFMVRVNPPFL